MPQEPASDEGKRFSRDLRRIREAQGVSIDDLNDETKIPRGLIDAFEETALFDHPQFNRVYLRSFTRTYAQVVGIAPDVALEALEEALAGSYRGRLAVEYLGEEPDEPEVAAEHEDAGEGTGASATAVPTESAADTPPESEEAPPAKASPPKEARPEPPKEARRERPQVPEQAASPPPREERTEPRREESAPPRPEEREREAAPPAADDDDWTTVSPPSARGRAETSRRSSRGRSAPPGVSLGSGGKQWIYIGIAAVVLAGLIWGVIALTSTDEPGAEAVAVADSADVQSESEESPTGLPLRDPSTIPSIGDTMDVRIIAANGVLDPIRVTVDDDLRRPYWVEEGDSMEFDPTSRIVIEELLENVALKIEGEPYPTDRRDAQNRIVITRDSAQAYLQSLAGRPAGVLPANADTTAADGG